MSFLDIIKTIVPLVLILGLLFFALVMVRRYSFSLNGKKAKLLKIEVLNNHLILPKKYLSVVRVQDKLFLLGISEGNITLLKEYEYDQSMESEQTHNDFKQTFKDMLKQNIGMR